MKRLRIILLSMLVLIVLAACGTDKQEETDEEEGVGFSLSNETIEEAANVPEKEKDLILEAFNQYIERLNEKDLEGYMDTISEKQSSYTREEEQKREEKMLKEKDLEGYMDTISEKPSSFTREEEQKMVEEMFEEYDFTREPSNVTIVKYHEEKQEAQVFSNLNNKVKQLSTGLETAEKSRQVTVFTKEKNEWKVKAVHAIGEN